MRLTSVTVRNYRCLKELTVDLDELTVLIGENNSGKTAFLEAIRVCLERLRGRSHSVFQEYDYHLATDASTPADADPIEITLRFHEPEPDAWPDEVVQELTNVLALKDGRYQLEFHLSSSFDAASGEFTLDWAFLDADGNPLAGGAKSPTHLTTLQRLCPAFYLSALRDAAQHFGARGRYWRAFLSETTIPEADRRELEKEFAALNTRLLGAHQPLADVRGRLEPVAEPVTALEEPEAHLHPCAIRALMTVVRDLPGQTLVSTHSGDLLAAVDPMAVRRFVHRDGTIRVFRIEPGTLDDEELRKFDFHVRRSRGELLFARCWLLGEGETEGTLLSGAAEALGLDLERAGVRCVEYTQTDVEMLVKVANRLGIAWYCVADDDDAGRKNAEKVKAHLEGAAEADRLTLPYTNPERFLCDHGFGSIYEAGMSAQKPQPTSPHGTPAYWDEVLKALPTRGFSKPAAAFEAVVAMKADPARVPQPLKDILNKAIGLGGG